MFVKRCVGRQEWHYFFACALRAACQPRVLAPCGLLSVSSSVRPRRVCWESQAPGRGRTRPGPVGRGLATSPPGSSRAPGRTTRSRRPKAARKGAVLLGRAAGRRPNKGRVLGHRPLASRGGEVFLGWRPPRVGGGGGGEHTSAAPADTKCGVYTPSVTDVGVDHHIYRTERAHSSAAIYTCL